MRYMLALILLTGCASGVRMNEQEAAACRAHGCSVWTDAELQALITKAAMIGAQSCRRGAAI